MFAIETSKDLLFVVLAICIVWLTIFFTWLLAYIISILRDITTITHRVRNVVDGVDRLTMMIKDRVENSTASFGLIARAAKELVTWFMENRPKKNAKKKADSDEE